MLKCPEGFERSRDSPRQGQRAFLQGPYFFQIGSILTLQRGKWSFKSSHLPVHCHLLPTYITWLHPCHPVFLSQIRHKSSHCVSPSLCVSLPFCARTHTHTHTHMHVHAHIHVPVPILGTKQQIPIFVIVFIILVS